MQFTTYMALINLSDVAGSYISGYALSLTSAPTIGFSCGLIMLAALVAVKRSGFGRRREITA